MAAVVRFPAPPQPSGPDWEGVWHCRCRYVTGLLVSAATAAICAGSLGIGCAGAVVAGVALEIMFIGAFGRRSRWQKPDSGFD